MKEMIQERGPQGGKTARQHQRDHKARQLAKGYRQLNLFVHDDDREKVRRFVKELEYQRSLPVAPDIVPSTFLV